MSSHAVLCLVVRPVSLSLKRVSEEGARTDCYPPDALVREINAARIKPTLWRALRVQSNRTHLERNESYATPAHSASPEYNC
jgi:hypothetical protein